MKNILITEFMNEDSVNLLKKNFNVNYNKTMFESEEKIKKEISNCEAIIVRNKTQLQKSILDNSLNLKFVGRLGVGLDNIDKHCSETVADGSPWFSNSKNRTHSFGVEIFSRFSSMEALSCILRERVVFDKPNLRSMVLVSEMPARSMQMFVARLSDTSIIKMAKFSTLSEIGPSRLDVIKLPWIIL